MPASNQNILMRFFFFELETSMKLLERMRLKLLPLLVSRSLKEEMAQHLKWSLQDFHIMHLIPIYQNLFAEDTALLFATNWKTPSSPKKLLPCGQRPPP